MHICLCVSVCVLACVRVCVYWCNPTHMYKCIIYIYISLHIHIITASPCDGVFDY